VSNQSIRDQWHNRFGNRDPKIVCVGLNYRDHTSESGFEAPPAPLLFAKFANTLSADGDPIRLPAGIGHVDAEAELAVIIGRAGRRIAENAARDYIAGYTCANDISARAAQFGDGQWFRGKGYDGFCPLGPRIVAPHEVDPRNLTVTQRLNGAVLQHANTSSLIFDIEQLIVYVSAVLTLEPGDLILTGTPSGVGFFREPKVSLADGDSVEIEIDGIGTLCNPVEAETSG
jgi:2-keto-4-pentenoate hydratase/2-oxohepta-3-ene-1,7-dioic acid hydratase in catechol pathway